MAMSVKRSLGLLTPFVLIALVHYGRYATLMPAGTENLAGRAKSQHQRAFKRQMAARMARVASEAAATAESAVSSAAAAASTAASAASTAASAATAAASSAVSAADSAVRQTVESVKQRHHFGGGLSSEAAMQKVLEQGGLKAGTSDVEGLGEVTTAEAFHAALPAGESVWLTFSNQAYLHFAQNWYMSVRAIGRHRQVVVAALDAPTLRTWRSLRVPVLDYSGSFGDTSDFRGIGSDQARFRKMGAMKVAAFLQLLELGRTVLVSDVDTVRVPRATHTHARRAGAARRSRRTLLRDRAPLDAAALLLPPRAALRSGWPTR